MLRTRWAAIGAAVAVTLGAGGIGLVSATSPSDAVTFVPIEPCRLFDTRPDFQVGARSSPLGPDETFTTQATGDNGECTGIPATATGLGMNVTAVDPTQATVLTIWGAGDRPNASSLNPTPGQPPTPNAVTSGLTGAGELNVWNAFGSVHVLVDIVGYYTDHNHDDRYYTEGEVDTALGAKANSADVYTKSESNGRYDNVDASFDSPGSQPLGTTASVVASVTVDTPTSGYVIVSSGGTLFNDGATNIITVSCSITTGTTIDSDHNFNAQLGDGSPPPRVVPAGNSRGFEIDYFNLLSPPSAETTYNLVCSTNTGTATFSDAELTAIFVPDPDAFGLVVVPFGED